MANGAENALNKALEACITAQDMIDLSAERLEGLRTQCAIGAELTQHEIRSLESKLINLFSKQLVAKKIYGKYDEELNKYPQIKQWLKVVGLGVNSIEGLCDKITTMEALLEASENIIREILHLHNVHDEEIRPLLIAVKNLKNHTKRQLRGESDNSLEPDLFWDSWVSPASHTPTSENSAKPRTSRSFGSSDKVLKKSSLYQHGKEPYALANRKSIDSFSLYPYDSRKNNNPMPSNTSHMTKSKSHEENLASQAESQDSWFDQTTAYKRFMDTEPALSSLESSYEPEQDLDSYLHGSQIGHRSVGMVHQINHRFVTTVSVTLCDFCGKSMVYGPKCKHCKNSYHKDCVEHVPPSCGLPTALVNIFAETIKGEGNLSPTLNKKIPSPLIFKKIGRKKSHRRSFISSSEESSSTASSCNSSTSSSPSFVYNSGPSKFYFPSNKEKSGCYRIDDIDEFIETQKSNDSDKTISGTLRSTDSDKTITGKMDSQGSDISDRSWTRQSCLSLNEWDIPYDEIILEDVLGAGRFGTVYRGNWHGRVAIKMLNMDNMDDKTTLETFKQEVAIFRKTRHENLVLFMGACMKPPHLAIITSLCKGMTLYTHIHIRKNKFNLNKLLAISKQISQGMGYLHARGIVHKDLKTKNIFYENGKVIITDFGLFSVANLCQGSRKGGQWMNVPKGWLCYLAPEVIRLLKMGSHQDDLPFTTASDMYAFGTVWYELLCSQLPFAGQPSESVIWQVGKGIKQSLMNLQATKEVKSILMGCWAYHPSQRLEFSKLVTLLTRIPLVSRKKLTRSPSYTHRFQVSAESAF